MARFLFAAVSLIAVGGCAVQKSGDPENGVTHLETTVSASPVLTDSPTAMPRPASATQSSKSNFGTPARPTDVPATRIEPSTATKIGNEAPKPYVGVLRTTPVTIDMQAEYRLDLADNCIIVIAEDGVVRTAAVAPGGGLEARSPGKFFVRSGSTAIALGERHVGRGARLSDPDLVRPVPAGCPKLIYYVR